MRTTQKLKVQLEVNGEDMTNTAASLENPLAVSFLYLVIFFSYNYFKYQRKSEAKLYFFRNQVSIVTVVIIVQETYQKQQALGLLCLGGLIHRCFKGVFWFSWKYGFAPKQGLWLCLPVLNHHGKVSYILRFDSHCRSLCLFVFFFYWLWPNGVTHGPLMFWTLLQILGFKDSTCKNIFVIWPGQHLGQWRYLNQLRRLLSSRLFFPSIAKFKIVLF